MKSRVQIAQWSANKHFDSQLTFSPNLFPNHENTENNLWKQYLATYEESSAWLSSEKNEKELLTFPQIQGA